MPTGVPQRDLAKELEDEKEARQQQERLQAQAAQVAKQTKAPRKPKKETAEKALSSAIPALEKAKNAIDCMKKGHIVEMKALGTPPPMVIVTAKCILILMGEKVSPND